MKKLDLIKAGAEILVSAGMGSIVGNAIRQTTSPEANRFTRIAIGFGGFVLTSMVSELATRHVNGIIDDVSQKVIEILRSDDEKDADVEPENPDLEPDYVNSLDDLPEGVQINQSELDGKLLPNEEDVKKAIKKAPKEGDK